LDDPSSAVLAATSGLILLVLTACEAALYGYSYARLMERAQRHGRGELFSARLARERQILFSLLVYEALFVVLFVISVTTWLDLHTDLSSAGSLLTALATCFVLLILPIRLLSYVWGQDHADGILFRLLGLMDAARIPVLPIVRVVDGLALALARLTGKPVDRSSSEALADEILSAVAEGESEGLLEEDEKEMIERIVELRDADAADAMTPRTDMVSIPVTMNIDDAVKIARERGHSRIPVFEENRDQIVGILYVKDILHHWRTDTATTLDLRVLMRKPYFVPEQKPISELLTEFKARKLHLAVVLDEYGGTAGIITIEDILEEIVGDIEDEYDPALAHPPLRVVDETTVEADARLHVDDLAHAIHAEIEDGRDFDSLGGFLFTTLGRVPAKGERVTVPGLRFTVLEANDRRIGRVRVERVAEDE
jgi:putative hemolysin